MRLMTNVNYTNETCGTTPVTADEVKDLIGAIPNDAAEHLRAIWTQFPPKTLADVVEGLRDCMLVHCDHCQSRPALPHEEPGRYLTRKGSTKYEARLAVLAQAFERVFSLPISGDPGGPLDPIPYE